MDAAASRFGDLARGIQVDGTFMAWGTGFAEANRLFGARHREGVPVAQIRCREVGGFAVLSGELTAPALDRPVLSAAFELAPVREALWRPEYWSDALSAIFGAPAQIDRSEIPPYADASGCVIHHANWSGDGFGIGLSVYGALRSVPVGRSAGMLWLSWDEKLAARPFLADWRSRCARLDGCAARVSRIDLFTTDDPAYPSFVGDGENQAVELPAAIAERRALSLALHRPDTLLTPRTIAAKLKPRRFALWRSDSDGIWCASTVWDSVAFPAGSPVKVDWSEVLAAKGPGYADLRIGSLWLRSGDRSREIARAAEWLRGIAGVTVARHEGYNA